MAGERQVWNWNSFGWGEWDWFYYWPKWSYRAWENIETRMLENWARITGRVQEAVTYTGELYAINPFFYRSFATRRADWWANIYAWWTLKLSMPADWNQKRILWFGSLTRAWQNNQTVYWIWWTSSWTGKIHRFDANYTGVVYDVATYTYWASRTSIPRFDLPPVLSYWNKIYIWFWNTINIMDSNEIVTQTLVLPVDSEIMSITVFQDQFRIYYNHYKESNTADWMIAYWDWSSSLVDNVAIYENSVIKTVVSNGSFDYVVFWDQITSDLYICQWLQRAPIRTNVEQSSGNTRSFTRVNVWCIREWIAYFWGQNKDRNYTLYSYWKYYWWTSDTLIPENTFWNNYAISWLKAREQLVEIYVDNIAWTNQWKLYEKALYYNESTVSPSPLSSIWKIYSYPLEWNFGSYTLKTIQDIYIWYSLYSVNDSIKIYVRKNANTYYQNKDQFWQNPRVLLKNITWNNYFNKKWIKINRTELLSLWLWDFYTLELRVDMEAISYSPILHQIKTIYLDNLKE
jgi:hypothetical protein